MSKAVDDRVVSLEFDNAQFEKSVNETLKMLEELKKSLKFDKAAENLSAITDAGKKVDLSTVGESVDKLNEKFSTMRLVGLMALSSIVDGAMQMAKKVASILMAPFNQIKTGGWARAMKIEDAKFMLEGLQVQWDKISKDINYGVADTAYGLDEAAKAASQLVASGVKFGDTYGETGNSPMAKALRGISGVAAMTNSTYEEISSIFTTVAGQGKMMTMQLRQLESRGLNVAATMATQFNKVADGSSEASDKFQESVKKMTKGAKVNEAAIRDMIQKGKVDFAIFSEAMDEAFGQHAKDANNTFTGALANVKAALSKIGAEFATPLIQDAIPVLNAVRKMINAIKTSMSGSGGIFDLFRTMSRGISNIFTSKIERITDFLTNRFTGISNINRGLWLIMTNILKIIKTIKTAFQNVFGGNTGDHVNNLAVGFEKLAWVLTPTDEALQGFGNILTVVFTIIKKVGTAIGWIISKLGGPMIRVLFTVINTVFGLIGKFGEIGKVIRFVIGNLDNTGLAVKLLQVHFGLTKETSEKLVSTLKKLRDILKKVGEVAKTALKYIALGIAAIVVAPIYLLYQGFLKLTQMDWSKFTNALKNAKSLIVELFTKFKESAVVQTALEGIKTAIGLVVGAVIYLGEKVGEFFTKLANGEITLDSIKEKLSNIPEAIKGVGDKIAGFFKRNKFFSPIVDGVKNMATQIWGFVKGIPGLLKALTPAKVMLITFSAAMVFLAVKANFVADAFVNIAGALLKWFHWDRVANIKLNNFLKTVGSFTQAIIALTGSLYVLSKIPNLKETAIILGSFIAVLAGIGVIYTILNRLVADKNSKSLFWQFARDLTLMSLGVYLVTSALVKLNAIDLKDVMKKLGVLAIAIGGIMGIATLFDNPKWSLVGKNGLATLLSMVGYAIAIYAAATAIKKLDGVDLSGLKGKWPELLAILVGLALTARAIAGIGLGIFAGALAIFLGFSYITKQMEKYALSAADSTAKLIDVTNTIKNHLLTVGANIKQMFNGILEAFKEDFFGTFSAVFTKISAAALIIIGIIMVLRKIIPSFVEVAKEGKYAKRAAKGFLTIAVAIAGLMLVAKFIADGMKDNPRAAENLMAVVGMISLLIVAVGAMAMLTGLGSGQYSAGSIKQIRRTFSSIALVFLSMAALSAVIADMSPAQFKRTNKILTMTLVTIGILVVLIAAMTVFSKGTKAGFGTFAGITLLFATMLGALALLMHMFDNMEDYSSLWKSIALITGIFVLMGGLFITISKIRYKAAPRAIWALMGGIIAIGGAIALFVKFMPDNNVVQKVAAISAAMVGVMTALTIMTGAIMHFAKDSKFSVTTGGSKGIGSRGTIMITLMALAEMIIGIFAIAASLAILGDRDPGRLLGQAAVITGVIFALAAITEGIIYLSKKLKSDTGSLMSSLFTLSVLTLIFGALSFVIAKLSQFVDDPLKALEIGASIELLMLGLVGIMKACSMVSLEGAKSLLALPMLLGLTAIFGVLGVIIGIMVKLGTDPLKAIGIGGAIEILLAGLVVISSLCGALAVDSLLALACIPALLGLTAVFGLLGIVIGILIKLGTDPLEALKVGASVELLLAGLVILEAALGAIALLGVLALLSLPALAGLVLAIGAIGLVIFALKKLNITNEDIDKVNLIIDMMWRLVEMLGVLGLATAGIAGEIVGVLSLGALVVELGVLTLALKKLETVDSVAIANGLNSVKDALNLLFVAAAEAISVAPGLGVLVLAAIGLGVACLAAGAGVNIFANGLVKLAEVTPTQLNNVIITVQAFIIALAESIATGLQIITQMVIDGLTSLRLAAVSVAEGFFPDLKRALFSESKGVKDAAFENGMAVSYAWVNGFRIPVGWHSNPDVIEDWSADTVTAINAPENGGAMINAAFQQGVKTGEGYCEGLESNLANGKKLTDVWDQAKKIGTESVDSLISDIKTTVGDFDWKSLTEKASNFFGEGWLSGGAIPSLGAIQNEMMKTIGLAGMVANAVTLASVGYYTTQEMYKEQLKNDIKYAQTQREIAVATRNRTKTTSSTYKTLTTVINGYNDDISKMQQTLDNMNGVTKDATESITTFGDATKTAGTSAKDFASNLVQTLESQMNIFSKFEQKSAMSKEELLGNMRSQIEGMTNWAAQMQELATKGIDKGLYQKLAEMGPQGAEYVGAFANMTAEEMAEANTLWAQSLVLPKSAAAMVGASYNAIGTNAITGLTNGMAAGSGQIYDSGYESGETLKKGTEEALEIKSPSKVYERIGMFIDQGLAKGIEKNQKRAIEAMEVMCQAMILKAEKILDKDKFASYGMNIVDGLTEGLGDEEANKKLNKAVGDLATKVKNKFTGPDEKGGVDEHSPSKVFYRFGKYIDEGLANGISDYTGRVIASTENLSGSALDAMRYTVANIASMINDEMEDPVITPVLDLSNVQAGVRTLNSVLAGNKALAAGINEDGTLQNGKSRIGGTTFIQNNYSPKALSRAEIYRQTNNQFARFRQQMG